MQASKILPLITSLIQLKMFYLMFYFFLSYSSVCEKNYNLQPGQIPLVCIDIDSKVNKYNNKKLDHYPQFEIVTICFLSFEGKNNLYLFFKLFIVF